MNASPVTAVKKTATGRLRANAIMRTNSDALAAILGPKRVKVTAVEMAGTCNHCLFVGKHLTPIDGLPGELECPNVRACERRITRNLLQGEEYGR